MNDLVASRRSFLKLFAATAAVASLPLKAEALTLGVMPAVPTEAVEALQPGVLHVLDAGGWRALGGINQFTTFPAPVHNLYWDLGRKHARPIIIGPPKIETRLFEADLERLFQMQYSKAHFGMSLPKCAIEFDGVICDSELSLSDWENDCNANLQLEVIDQIGWRMLEH